MSSFKRILQIMVFIICVLPLRAQTYPFSLPDTVHATFTINTERTERAKDAIMGVNIFHFTEEADREFFRQMDPVAMRFPHGVWANFYKWTTDTYQQDSYDNKDFETSLQRDIDDGEICGIEGLTTLNAEKQKNTGKPYDVMWTYSVNFDDPASNVARIRDRKERGLEVKDIELGNEHFWKSQRSNRTSTEADFLKHTKAISAMVKAEYPDVRLSIPLSWRRSHAAYNKAIAGDMTHYDAISLHRYAGADPDVPGESNSAYSALLTSRLTIKNDVDWLRENYGPDKPIWMTEWGVSAGENVHTAACLGMADVYLLMFDNQDAYDRANWFCVNGKLNSMVELIYPQKKPKSPIEKRGYLYTYEIIRNVFEDAIMYASEMETSQITNDLGSTNVVSAKAVIKDGKTMVLAVNLSDKPVVFNMRHNENALVGEVLHEALAFEDLGVVASIPFSQSPLSIVPSTEGSIILPPLSINQITLVEGIKEADDYLGFLTPITAQRVEAGTLVQVEAMVGDSIDEVQLYVDNTLIRTVTDRNFVWGEDFTDVSLSKLSEGDHSLKLVGKRTNDGTLLESNVLSITVYASAVERMPYLGELVSIPGLIEAEDFDQGAEGMTYHDVDEINESGLYRSEGVDLLAGGNAYVVKNMASGEWQDYSVDVKASGKYDIIVTYSSVLISRSAAMGLSLFFEKKSLVDNYELPVTTSWDQFKKVTIATDVSFTKGFKVLRAVVKEPGYYLDCIELRKNTFDANAEYPVNDVHFQTLVNGQSFDFATPIKVEAHVGVGIQNIQLLVDGDTLRSIDTEHPVWGLDSLLDEQLFQLSEGNHTLQLLGAFDNDLIIKRSIIIKINERTTVIPQPPYQGVAFPIPGKIEAELYDTGGEGVAYHDSDVANTSALFRNDGVDILAEGTGYCVSNTVNDEWQEYTIDVQETGVYDIVISYSSDLSRGSARIGVSLPEEDNELVSSYKLFSTGGWSLFVEETIAEDITLEKGKHILRTTVVQQGYYLDWLMIKGEGSASVESILVTPIMIYPNPSITGLFTLSELNEYEVYSIEGVQVTSGRGKLIDLSGYSKGVYFVKTPESVCKIIYE